MEGLESFFTWSQQLHLFLLSCLFGIPLGILFDIFRVFRSIIPHGKIAVALEDLLFFGIYGIFLMCFTVTEARSEFRFFYSLGNLLGFVLYYITVGSAIIKIIRKIMFIIKKILCRIFSPFIRKSASVRRKIRDFFIAELKNVKFNKKNIKKPLIDNGDLLYNKNKTAETKKSKRKNVKGIGSKGIKKEKEKRNVQPFK